MATNAAQERVTEELNRAVETMGADLDRVELLSAALGAFNRPVPEYEPGFQHLRHLRLNAYELDSQLARRKSAGLAKKLKASRTRN